MHYIVAVKFAGTSKKREQISRVIWVNADTFVSGNNDTASMVDFVEKNPGTVKVTDGKTTATVEVVNATPKYLRSEKDDSKTDNLVNLTTF